MDIIGPSRQQEHEYMSPLSIENPLTTKEKVALTYLGSSASK
jgi:hypothetical protein